MLETPMTTELATLLAIRALIILVAMTTIYVVLNYILTSLRKRKIRIVPIRIYKSWKYGKLGELLNLFVILYVVAIYTLMAIEPIL